MTPPTDSLTGPLTDSTNCKKMLSHLKIRNFYGRSCSRTSLFLNPMTLWGNYMNTQWWRGEGTCSKYSWRKERKLEKRTKKWRDTWRLGTANKNTNRCPKWCCWNKAWNSLQCLPNWGYYNINLNTPKMTDMDNTLTLNIEHEIASLALSVNYFHWLSAALIHSSSLSF